MKISTRYSGKSGLYVCVSPTFNFDKVYKLLSPILDKHGVKMDPREDLHCTLVYSRNDTPHPLQVMKMVEDPDNIFPATCMEVEHWPGHDNSNYLVLKLDSPELCRRHRLWLSIGAKHSFPDYMPHITLAHNFAADSSIKAVVKELNAALKANPMTITMSGEHAEDLKED